MSDYGLIITNSSGNIQVDSTYTNLMLAEKHTVSSVSTSLSDMMLWYADGGQYDIMVEMSNISIFTVNFSTSYTEKPTIGFRSTQGSGAIYRWLVSGGSYIGVKLISDINVYGSSADIFVYSKSPPTSNEAYGIRVYNSSGNLVFNSAYAPIKISSIESIPIYSLGASDDPLVYTINGTDIVCSSLWGSTFSYTYSLSTSCPSTPIIILPMIKAHAEVTLFPYEEWMSVTVGVLGFKSINQSSIRLTTNTKSEKEQEAQMDMMDFIVEGYAPFLNMNSSPYNLNIAIAYE